MEEKVDLRIVKTKKTLREALLSLISEKDFDKIAVTEICNRALVNRMTFYKYYEDKYQLLDYLFEELTKDLIVKIDKMPHKANEDELDFVIRVLKEVYSFCLDYNGPLASIAEQSNVQIIKTLSRVCLEHIKTLFEKISQEHNYTFPVDMVSYFIYGGFSSLFYYWLTNQEKYTQDTVNKLLDDLEKQIRKTNLFTK